MISSIHVFFAFSACFSSQSCLSIALKPSTILFPSSTRRAQKQTEIIGRPSEGVKSTGGIDPALKVVCEISVKGTISFREFKQRYKELYIDSEIPVRAKKNRPIVKKLLRDSEPDSSDEDNASDDSGPSAAPTDPTKPWLKEFNHYSNTIDITQVTRTTKFVYLSSHSKKAKIGILEGPSPFNSCEILLCRFRHNTFQVFIPGRSGVRICSVD
jgi:hypothetical protein